MKRKYVNILLYLLSAAFLIAGVVLLVRQYVLLPGAYEPPATPAPTATPVPTPVVTQTPGVSAAPVPTPSPTPYVKPIPTRIYFTKAQVMADIVPVGIVEEGERKGQMDTVDDPDLAAWYEPGPAPGEEGNALINGHKSWKGKIGRFSVLWDMEPGDEIAIEYEDGTVKYFYAVSVDFYPYDGVPNEVMDLSGESRVTLITCYGEFDRTAGTSKQRCIVVCQSSDMIAAKETPAA